MELKKNSTGNIKPIQNIKSNKISFRENVSDPLSQDKFLNNDSSLNKGLNGNSTQEFPHQDKYLDILENNRALQRKIKQLDKYLDSQEMILEQTLQNQKLAKINIDKDMVDLKYSNFKNMLDLYNDSLEKVNEKIHPVCQVRYEFLKRLIRSYTGLFSKIKSNHVNEMTKYITKINLLITKNKAYEKMFEEAKRKEASQNQITDFLGMNNKLDFVEREMSISTIFKQGRDEKESLMNLIAEKVEKFDQDDFDPLSKNVLSQLQEILSTMVSVNSSSGLLSSYTSIESPDFKVADWEKDIVGKLKNAQFTAAKAMMNVLNNKDKYVTKETQTENDPLK